MRFRTLGFMRYAPATILVKAVKASGSASSRARASSASRARSQAEARSGRAARARPSHFPCGSDSLAAGRPSAVGISWSARRAALGSSISVTVTRVLFGHETHEEEGEEPEEENRLADGHQGASDLLVLQWIQAPEAGGLDVGVVEGRREKCEKEPQRAREDEGREEVGGLPTRRKVPRLLVEDRPPEEEPCDEIAEMLEPERGLVVESRLVGDRHVPERIGGEPERQGDD